MAEFTIGQVSVQVVPSVRNINKTVAAKLSAQAREIGNEVGRRLGEGIQKGLNDPLKDLPKTAPKQGAEAAGAFARSFKTRVSAALKSLPDVEIHANSSDTDRKIASIREELRQLSDKTIGIDLDSGEAQTRIKELQTQLRSLGRNAPVNVRVDSAVAEAELARFQAEVNRLDGQTANVRVSDGGGLSTLTRQSSSLVTALSFIAPAAIPAAAAIAAIGAAGTGAFAAAGAGIAGMVAASIPGISNVAKALQTQSAAQDQVTRATSSGTDTAQRAMQVAAARRQLEQATSQAAYAHSQALGQVRQAEESLAKSQQSARTAQLALNQARAQAKRDLQDLANNEVDAALAVRGAQLSLHQAQTDLAQQAQATAAANQAVINSQKQLAAAQANAKTVNAKPGATKADKNTAAAGVKAAQQAVKDAKAAATAQVWAQKQAQLAYDQAIQSLKEQQLQLRRLKSDKAAADKAGIDGDRNVVSARQQLQSANQNVIDQERDLLNARQNVARVDAQSANQIASARDAVARATRTGASATDAASAADQRYGAAMAALTGPERDLLKHFQDLKTAYTAWAKTLEKPVLGAWSAWMDTARKHLDLLTPVTKSSATAMTNLAKSADKSLGGPFWTKFSKDIGKAAGPAIEGLGKSAGNLAKGLAGLIDAFLPYAPQFTGWLQKITKSFADWSTGGGAQKAVDGLMGYFKDNGPLLGQTLKNLALAIGNIVKSIAPLGTMSLSSLSLLAKLTAGMSPGQIQALAAAFLALRAAMTFSKVYEGISKTWTSFQKFTKLKPVKASIDGIGNAAKGTAKKFASMAKAASTAVASAGKATASGVATAGKATASGAKTGAKAVGTGVANAAKTAGSAVSTAAVASWQGLSKAMSTAGTAAKTTALWIGNTSKALALQGLNLLKNAGLWLINATRTAAYAVVQGIVRAATATWTAVQWLLNVAMNANPIGLVIIAITALVAAVIWIATKTTWFQTIWKYVWGFLKWSAAQAWKGIKAIINWLGAAWNWVYAKAIKPAVNGAVKIWRWMVSVAKWLWNGIKWALNQIAKGFNWANGIIKKAWNGAGALIKSVYHKVMDPVFKGIHKAVGWVKDGFWLAVEGIKKAWNWLKSITAKPVNFVIRTVYNGGIVPFVNKVASWVGLKGLNKATPIKGYKSGGVFDGVLPGYSPNRDNMIANTPIGPVGLAGGEGIIKAKRVKEYGPGLIDAINSGQLPGFAGGGIFDTLTSAGKSLWRGAETAGSWAWGKVKDGASWIQDHTVKALWNKLGSWVNGAIGSIKGGDNTLGGTVRAIPKKLLDGLLKKLQKAADAMGGSGQAADVIRVANKYIGTKENPMGSNRQIFGQRFGMNGVAWCAEFISEVFKEAGAGKAIPRSAAVASFNGSKLKRRHGAPVPGDLFTYGNSHINLFTGPGKRTVGGNQSDAVTADTSHFGRRTSTLIPNYSKSGGAHGGKIPHNKAAYYKFAKDQMAQMGWSVGYNWPSLLKLWNRESGWNPNAVNKSSGAYGIPQALNHGHPFNLGDAGAQIAWGLNYIKGRYGNAVNAWRHSQATGWYKDGGILPEAFRPDVGLFDNGGWLRPGQLAYNGLSQPEAVLTQKQLEVVATGGGSAQAPYNITVNQQLPNGASSEDVVRGLTYELRRAHRGGKYR